jgi:ArsR family transcriptional regulator
MDLAMDLLLGGLRAAAEPTRLRMLALLAEGELTVSELTQILGQSQPRVSRHLRLLGEAGLLERVPEGNWAFYRLASGGGAGRLAQQLVGLLPADDPGLTLDRARLEDVKRARADVAAAYFRKSAARWDEIRSLYVDEAEVERALLALLPPDRIESLLDIGTGTGRILELYGSRGVRGVGIDLSREMLAVARAKLDGAGLARCRVQQGDMYRLPWPAESFDAVTVHQVLHFADRPAAVVVEAARVLKAGGRLVIADFAPHELEFLRREHAHRRLGFGDDEIAGWAGAAGLRVEAPIHLPGERLTVTLWAAERPSLAARDEDARAHRSTVAA